MGLCELLGRAAGAIGLALTAAIPELLMLASQRPSQPHTCRARGEPKEGDHTSRAVARHFASGSDCSSSRPD